MALLKNCYCSPNSSHRYYSSLRNPMTTVHLRFMIFIIMLEYTQARIGYFWHITDLHLDTIYSTQGDVMRSCWRIERQTSSSNTRAPGRYGDYLCDSPWSLIESATRAMKSRQGDNVEFVLWTGDGLSHSAHPMFESKKLEILRNITDLLGRTFSSQFVFPVLGHEDGTTTNFRHMGELWRHWLPSEALQTFEKGGYYSIEQTKSRLRIIALNTNFMRHDPKYSQSHLAAVRQRQPSINSNGISESKEYKNFYYHHGNMHQHHGHASDWSSTHNHAYNNHHRGISVLPNGSIMDGGGRVSALLEFENQDTEKQWSWLEEVLYKSKINKETVYIVGHIPPGSDERHIGLQQNGHTTFTENNNKRYLELVRKYSPIIQGQFFGHLHSDSFRIIYDDKGKPVSWMMISPSVTPRKMNVGSNNPAMRLYKFDTDSGQLLDYTQYYMDLEMANTLGEPNWIPEYNLTHYYSLTDISAISLHNFVDRFTSNDGSWFAKYYRANSVRYQTEPCEGVCMLNHYCAITRVDYKEFRQCLEKEQSALRSCATLFQNDDKHVYILTTIMMILMMTTMTWNFTYIQHTKIIVKKMFMQFVNAKIKSNISNIKIPANKEHTINNATTTMLGMNTSLMATAATIIGTTKGPVELNVPQSVAKLTSTAAPTTFTANQMHKIYRVSVESAKNVIYSKKQQQQRQQQQQQQQQHTCNNCLQRNLQTSYNKTIMPVVIKSTTTILEHCNVNATFSYIAIWPRDEQNTKKALNNNIIYHYDSYHCHRNHHYCNNAYISIQKILIMCNIRLNRQCQGMMLLLLQYLSQLELALFTLLRFHPTHKICNGNSMKFTLLYAYKRISSINICNEKFRSVITISYYDNKNKTVLKQSNYSHLLFINYIDFLYMICSLSKNVESYSA